MKHIVIFTVLFSISGSVFAQETSWLEKLKSFVGLNESNSELAATVTSIDTSALVKQLTQTLDITQEQAVGGLGAIFNYVKGNVSAQQFEQLSQSLPGINELMANMPKLEQLPESEGLSSLLDKASEYSESLSAINDVKKQFAALGLDANTMNSFADTIQNYLDSEQGQQAKQIIKEGLGRLLG